MCYNYTMNLAWYAHFIIMHSRGGSRIFQRGGLKAMVICIHIAIIHIIILNEVHCNLLKAIDA